MTSFTTRRILAIDAGQRRIGLALSDPTSTIASPIGFINRSTPDQEAHTLHQIITANNVQHIIVGLPLTLSGNRGAQAQLTERWIHTIEQRLTVSVERVDERLTTTQAHRSLALMGLSARDRRQHVDTTAATLLLQSYLDSHRQNSP